MPRMTLSLIGPIVCLGALVCLSYLPRVNKNAVGQEIRDLTIYTPYGSRHAPKSADFYLNARPIGRDREAFEDIIGRISQLPAGTSIVWGPNYSRCGSCSGSEPPCLPRHLFPDLWEQLEKIVTQRRLTLSSDFPGPWIAPTSRHSKEPLPAEVFSDDSPAGQRFDMTINMRCERSLLRSRTFKDDQELNDFELDMALDKLELQSRVLFQITLVDLDLANQKQQDIGTANLVWVWKHQIAPRLRSRKLSASLVVPALLAHRTREEVQTTETSITWQNYRGAHTPHREVIYLVDDTYVGSGDQGFDQVLQRLDHLPQGTKVRWTQYKWSGRRAFDNFADEELRQRNDALKGLVPFKERRQEFDQRLRDRKLVFDEEDPETEFPGERPTVLDWSAGDKRASTIASVGRIVHHGEEPRPAAVRFGWTNYVTHDSEEREPESTAGITINGRVVGKGFDGFAEGVKRIEALPPGSVVQVKVCLRTKGPFICPLIYEGHRHFERTGYEPYFGMYDWLIAVAAAKQLEIEWLPDEVRSCYDCELNR